ncbi:hypothetical protein F5I97DRAFT_279688 [Phlebopus sp. FC_14]|nr:hypothetical protein F5I97DRAFT_279688 [Phlebopus sp. FC_14]
MPTLIRTPRPLGIIPNRQIPAILYRLLDLIPRADYRACLKYCIYIVLVANAGSLPFVWHSKSQHILLVLTRPHGVTTVRVFWPIFAARLEYYALRSRLIFTPKAIRTKIITDWGENLCPVGTNPFELVTVYRRWASIDDADMFGMHLSNSSYAKALDSARLRVLVKAFPAWGRSGGQMALGATHYHFIREIPFFATYEIRTSIGSWDHKWMYLIARYVTLPNRLKTKPRSSVPTSIGTTPSHASSTSSPSTPNQNGTTTDAVHKTMDAIIKARTPILEPDGAVLHCIAVSQICFKHGRITIPPAVLLASEGFSKPPPPPSTPLSSFVDLELREPTPSSYSRTNPPPNWPKSQALRVAPTGSPDTFRTFLRGGWRDVPQGERWWEEALGGPIEEQRRANLDRVEALRVGLERTRAI